MTTSKPKRHRGTTEEKSATEYYVEPNPHYKPRSGDWAGKFVPTRDEQQKKAARKKFSDTVAGK